MEIFWNRFAPAIFPLRCSLLNSLLPSRQNNYLFTIFSIATGQSRYFLENSQKCISFKRVWRMSSTIRCQSVSGRWWFSSKQRQSRISRLFSVRSFSRFSEAAVRWVELQFLWNLSAHSNDCCRNIMSAGAFARLPTETWNSRCSTTFFTPTERFSRLFIVCSKIL